MSDDPNTFRGLPHWPEEAKELPEEEPQRSRSHWRYILGGIGLVPGVVLSLEDLKEPGVIGEMAPATMLFRCMLGGLIFGLIGYGIDRISWGST